MKDDISLAPVQTPSNGAAGVYLISYADGPEVFFKNQNALAASAINKGFDFILNYRRHHIDPLFLKDHVSIFDQKKGAGYWLWKPWIILHTLETTPENAIIFYADTGFVFNSPISEFVSLAQKYDMILTYFDLKGFSSAGKRTKREALIQLGGDTAEYRNLEIMPASGFIVLRNTPLTRAFIKKWLNSCTNEAILTDVPSSLPEYPGFELHRHDQSLLGILHHLEPQGIHLFPFSQLNQYAFWHHRPPETSLAPWRPTQEQSSLLPYAQRNPYLFALQDFLLNNRLIVWIRSTLNHHFLGQVTV